MARTRDLATEDMAFNLGIPERSAAGAFRSMYVKQNASGSADAVVSNNAARIPIPSGSSMNRSQAIVHGPSAGLGLSQGTGKLTESEA